MYKYIKSSRKHLEHWNTVTKKVSVNGILFVYFSYFLMELRLDDPLKDQSRPIIDATSSKERIRY